MTRPRIVLILIALALAVTITGCDPLGLLRQGSPGEQAVADLVNDHRVSMGLSPLEWSGEVYVVAEAHSEDMRDRDFFAHDNPDGDSPFDRLDAAGVSYATAGENIALGYQTPEAVVQGWLDSSGHRANIERASFTHHGIGYVEDGHYWTHVFIGQ